MKARFFYAPAVFKTWVKLFVLTEDGRFYCEYLDNTHPSKVDEIRDFNTFQASSYKWNGYQSIEEIDEQTARKTSLTQQANWIDRYLESLKK